MKVTQEQLILAYTVALQRLGSYSDIRIDAMTRDEYAEIRVFYKSGLDWLLYYQGCPKQFKPLI